MSRRRRSTGLARRPLDRVVAVTSFVFIRTKLAFRGIAATNVLHHDCISALNGMLERGVTRQCELFPVRSPVHQHREGALIARSQYVGTQHDAVSHGHGFVFLDDEITLGGRCLNKTEERCSREGPAEVSASLGAVVGNGVA